MDDDDDACSSPTKKHKYKQTVVSPAIDKSRGDIAGMDNLYPNQSHEHGGENGFDPMNLSVQKFMCSLYSVLQINLMSINYQTIKSYPT